MPVATSRGRGGRTLPARHPCKPSAVTSKPPLPSVRILLMSPFQGNLAAAGHAGRPREPRAAWGRRAQSLQRQAASTPDGPVAGAAAARSTFSKIQATPRYDAVSCYKRASLALESSAAKESRLAALHPLSPNAFGQARPPKRRRWGKPARQAWRYPGRGPGRP